jgi:inorganic pyrophosphatase/exopolyphosphatase
MFSSKSSVNADNLYQILFQDFATKTVGDKKVGIAQIEIVDLEPTLDKLNKELVGALTQLRKEDDLDYIFFTGIDIFKGFNIFYTIDKESEKLFSEVLEIPKLKPGYKTDYIIMRKQIWPGLEMILNSPKN